MKSTLTIVAFCFSFYSFSQAGALDPSFGIGGRVIFSDSILHPYVGNALVGTSTGQLIVAGSNGSRALLARFNEDGTVDESFGPSGNGITFSTAQSSTEFTDLIALPSGQLLAVGGKRTNGYDFQWFIARYNENGSPDNTFGAGGELLFLSPNVAAKLQSVRLQTDEKILLAGSDQLMATVNRRLPDGSLDTTFGTNGWFHIPFSANYNYCFINDMLLQPSGNIIVAGTAYDINYYTHGFIASILPDGSLDTSFGDSGIKILAVAPDASSIESIVPLNDGNFLFGGSSLNPLTGDFYGEFTRDFFVGKIHADGTVDSTFGTNGGNPYGFPTPYLNSSISKLLLQGDEKIIACGYASFDGDAAQSDLAIARYNSDGSIDTTFASQGFFPQVFQADSGTQNRCEDGLLLPNGKIILTGNYSNYSNTEPDGLAVARIYGDNYPNISVSLNEINQPSESIYTDPTVYYSGNTVSLPFKVYNTGNDTLLLLDPNLIELTDDGASYCSSNTDNLSTSIAPGDSSEFMIAVDGCKTGPVTTTLSIFNNDGEVYDYHMEFTVNFLDTVAPVLSCPEEAYNYQNSYVVYYDTPVATDNCEGVTLSLVDGLPSGAEFPGDMEVTYEATDASGNTATCTFYAFVNVEGISENETTTFSFFPNPTDGQIIIKTIQPNEDLTIVDLSGKVILKQTLTSLETTIDLSAQSPGIYFLQVGNLTQKIIKQ